MAKEFGNDSKAVRFISMNRLVIVSKCLLEAIVPDPIQLAKSFADQAIVARIGPLLRRTLYDHVTKLNLFSLLQFDFQQFMHCFFIAESILQGQIDDSSQIDEVGFCLVLDTFFLLDRSVSIITFAVTSIFVRLGFVVTENF